MEINKIIQGNCLEVMKGFEDNSVDTIITDPPYGLSFMGKKWDYDVPSVELWQECLRILKPGGTALIFASSRTQHRMACNVEDAGFILKDCIMYLYGSGFPKATDISKQLNKTKGAKRKVVKEGYVYGMSKGQKADGYRPEDYISKQLSNEAITPETKLWNGWKSHGLKPAYEPILVVMKPNEGSYAENALKHGVSGLNINGGRVGFQNKEDEKESKEKNQHTKYSKSVVRNSAKNGIYQPDNRPPENYNPTGRFPANIILDSEAGRLLDEQSGTMKSHSFGKGITKNKPSDNITLGGGQTNTEYLDKGGASRFFYCAKASKSERNAGCEGLDNEKFTAGNYSQSPVCKDCNKTLNGTNDHSKCSGEVYYREMESKKTQNNHPTVKPLKLMEYLCTLTKTPTGGLVLDPFAGSGTTLVACQNTKRDFIGIEREKEYCKIAEARLKSKRQTTLI